MDTELSLPSPPNKRYKQVMASSSIFPILLLLLLAFLFSIAEANVDDTCKAMAASNFTIDYDFCVASLQSDPESSTADARGLALIAVRLSLATATSTKINIDGLIQGSLDPTVKAILGLCSNSYSDMIPSLSGSINSIKAGNNTDAVEKLDFVKDRPLDCEDTFLEGGKQSPVAKKDNDLADLTTLALAITISLV